MSSLYSCMCCNPLPACMGIWPTVRQLATLRLDTVEHISHPSHNYYIIKPTANAANVIIQSPWEKAAAAAAAADAGMRRHLPGSPSTLQPRLNH